MNVVRSIAAGALVAASLLTSCGVLLGDEDDAGEPIVVVAPCAWSQVIDDVIQLRSEAGVIDAEPALCEVSELPEPASAWWADSDHWWLILEEQAATTDLTHDEIERLATNGLDFSLLGSFCDGNQELWQRLPSGRDIDQEATDLILQVAHDLERSTIEC